jgi:hypothetical protein
VGSFVAIGLITGLTSAPAREYQALITYCALEYPPLALATISFESALIRTGAKMGTRETHSPAFKRFRLSFFEDKALVAQWP